ncbi:FIST N-terminal domain-containing protein [Dongia sp.]|uniref:FIST N-terminal domain-containing protein n=1 Tax=Dongia sp. TaxID=1977262 RepID=UPI0035ADB896
MAVLEADAPGRDAGHSGILWAVESSPETGTVRDVVLSVLEAIASDESALVLLFCSPQFHIAEIAAAVAEYGCAAPVVGCTTAGEITPLGYRHGTITGLSLPKTHFSLSLQLFEQLAQFDLADGFSAARTLLTQHEAAEFHAAMPNSFAILLNDGLSMREEAIASAFGNALGHVPLVGGSAGISAVKNEPNMLLGGQVLTNSAILMLISTDLDFRVFQTQHFEALSQKLVITRADPSRRIVMQINAEPAAQEYARLLGLTRADLTAQVFALHPLVVRAGGRFYARSIQKVNDDDSLQFFCAIDEGIVLSIARSGDLVADLEAVFEKLRKDLGSVQATIGFDCILRYIEMEQGDMLADVSHLHDLNNVIGFNTYGEQFGTMHMSQTFTGIAFGRPR